MNGIRNAELFRRIADAIEECPAGYDQGHWCRRLPLNRLVRLRLSGRAVPADGYTRCIAGWAAHLTGWKPVARDDSAMLVILAGSALGINMLERVRLFDARWVPGKEYDSVPEALRAFADGAVIL